VVGVDGEIESGPLGRDLPEGTHVERRRHQAQASRRAHERGRDAWGVRQARPHALQSGSDAAQQRHHPGRQSRRPGRVEGALEDATGRTVQPDEPTQELRVLPVQLEPDLDAHAPADEQWLLHLCVAQQREQVFHVLGDTADAA
jgi:hypothetical protein